MERVAAVPLENLSGDAALDWIASVSTPLLVLETAGAPGRMVLGVTAERESAGVRATQVLRGYYTASGGKVRLMAALYDTANSKLVRNFEETGEPGEVLARLASELGAKGTGPVATAALEPYGRSLLEKDAARKRELLEAAIAADAAFTPAAIALAQAQAETGDGEAARQTLRTALAKHAPGWEHSRLSLALATLDRDSAGLLRALEDGLRYAPNDSDAARSVGEALIARHRYNEAARYLSNAAAIEPTQAGIWNLLAYANAYRGKLEEAKQSLAQYRQYSPDDPNVFDTTGEVHWFFGQFNEAEANFLEAQRRNPQFLGGLEFSKAALARFLAGDVPGADRTFERYLESRRAVQDPGVDLRQAHWFYLTGRPQKAHELAQALAKKPGEIAVLAQTFRAVWQLQEGDPAAAETARQAAQRAQSPATMTQAGIVSLLAEPAMSPADWSTRVNRTMGTNSPPALRKLVLAYALLLHRHYRDAGALLESMYAEAPPDSSGEIRMLLAKVKLETGDKAGARKLLERYPLPPQPGESVFASFYFPAFREWRKAVGL